MRGPYLAERSVANTDHDPTKKPRSDVARKVGIQARNDTLFTEAEAARE